LLGKQQNKTFSFKAHRQKGKPKKMLFVEIQQQKKQQPKRFVYDLATCRKGDWKIIHSMAEPIW
jgi:hypothetical protein